MSDFERELRGAKSLAQRRAQQKVEREARERDQRIEREKREALERRRRAINQYIIPNKPMIDRLLRALGRETWREGNYGVRFELYEDLTPSLQSQVLAKWEIGRAKYAKIRDVTYKYQEAHGLGAVIKNARSFVEDLTIDKSPTSWAPLGSKPLGKGGYGISELEIFVVLLLLKGDGSPYFAAGGYNKAAARDRTEGIEEQELKDLLTREFLKGPGRPSSSGSSYSGHRRDGDGYGGLST